MLQYCLYQIPAFTIIRRQNISMTGACHELQLLQTDLIPVRTRDEHTNCVYSW